MSEGNEAGSVPEGNAGETKQGGDLQSIAKDFFSKLFEMEGRVRRLEDTYQLINSGPMKMVGILLRKEHFHAALDVFDGAVAEGDRVLKEIAEIREMLKSLEAQSTDFLKSIAENP